MNKIMGSEAEDNASRRKEIDLSIENAIRQSINVNIEKY